ncbi:lipocalin family protein [Pontimicrobium sp. MEBiC06410]
MKRLLTLLLFVFIFNSCTNNPETFIPNLEGYWEIENVTMADGTKRDYKINTTIDYIMVNDNLKGFRKKMKPLFNGTYETSKAVEYFTLKLENDSLNIYYNTAYASWKETILFASKEQLKVVNQNNHVYLYKRFSPININE